MRKIVIYANHFPLTLFSGAVFCIALMLHTGCVSRNTNLQHRNIAPIPAEQSVVDPMQLPSPQSISKYTNAVAELRIRKGADFHPTYLQNVTPAGEGANLSSVYNLGTPQFNDLAFSVYSFNLDTGSPETQIHAAWNPGQQPPVDSLWIGLSNWSVDGWNWKAMDTGVPLSVGSFDPYRQADGTVLVAVVLATEGSGQLDWLRIGGNAPPVILVDVTGDGERAPALVSIDATASHDIDGSITSFTWDWFANGTVEVDNTAPTIEQYDFILGGNNQVLITATDDLGLSSELIVDLTLIPHSDWWCEGANRYNNRRSLGTGPGGLTEEPEPAWSFDLVDGPIGVLVGANGTIYCGTRAGTIYAIDPTTGLELNRFDESGGPYIRLRAIGPDGSAYALIDNGSPDDTNAVLSLDSNLAENWRITGAQGGRDIHGFTLGGDVLVSYADNELRSINPVSQALQWSYTLPYAPRGIAATGNDGSVFIGTTSGTNYGLFHDGTLRAEYWSRGVLFGHPVLNSQGMLLLASDDGVLTGFLPGGEEVFYSTPGIYYVRTASALGYYMDEERLYLGDSEYQFFSIEMDGNVGWNYIDPVSDIRSVLVDSNENIFLSNYDKLMSVRPNKNPRWDFEYTYTSGFMLNVHALTQDGSMLVSTQGDYMLHYYQGL